LAGRPPRQTPFTSPETGPEGRTQAVREERRESVLERGREKREKGKWKMKLTGPSPYL